MRFGYYVYGNMFLGLYEIIGLILVLIGAGFMLYAQGKVNSSYRKYAKIRNNGNVTGVQIAREILDSNGLQEITIVETTGKLSDHYNPKKREIALSKDIYHGTSIASAAIAAHECGHAIQHKEGYQPLIFRNTILPFCNIGQSLGWVALMIGLFLGNTPLAWLGVIGMTSILLFQIATLPVEFDASSRALRILQTYYLQDTEYHGAKSMLSAAALTYVAAMVSTLLNVLRIILIVMGRSSRD